MKRLSTYLLCMAIGCFFMEPFFCMGQSDSSSLLSSRSEKPPSGKGGYEIREWITYFNDFETNPAITAYYTKFNINLNTQYTFMGPYFLNKEYHARFHFKLPDHGGFSLRYEQNSKGLFTYKNAGAGYNYRFFPGRNQVFSFAAEGMILTKDIDWSNTTLPDMISARLGLYYPTSAKRPYNYRIPDFNLGFTYSNNRLVAELMAMHIMAPNQSGYLTPGLGAPLYRKYIGRLGYAILFGKENRNQLTVVPGIGWQKISNQSRVITLYASAMAGFFKGTIDVCSDHSYGIRITGCKKKKYDAKNIRISLAYRRYVLLSKDFKTEIGGFKFGLNYSFGGSHIHKRKL